ncbi:hypothetical protein ACBI99_23555 [Nonomuraea sp. ATR24]|uniref:hypothetical protein n=1 Tax=unclassified Nonomuraea TaxID=2593643 RepID=UPI0033CE0D4E
MGDRAHFVIKRHGSWSLRYSPWAGYDLELELLPGPAAGLAHAERQRADTTFMNEILCTGAALVDVDEQRLLWFSPCRADPSYRWAALRVLATTWAGWRVEWAYDGLADLVRAVGEDPAGVAAPRSMPVPPGVRTPEELAARMPMLWLDPAVHPPGSPLPASLPTWPDTLRRAAPGEPVCLVTVARAGTVRGYPVSPPVDAVIGHGPASLDTYAAWEPVPAWPDAPTAGIHLDADTRTAGVWTTRDLAQVLPDAPRLWPGWRWEPWQDRHAEHLRRCAPAVTFPGPSLRTGLLTLAAAFHEHRHGGPATRGISALLGLTASVMLDERAVLRAIDDLRA